MHCSINIVSIILDELLKLWIKNVSLILLNETLAIEYQLCIILILYIIPDISVKVFIFLIYVMCVRQDWL